MREIQGTLFPLAFNRSVRLRSAPDNLAADAGAGIEPSVGSKGDSYDCDYSSAVRSIGLFKTEVIRCRGAWRHVEDVKFATLERVWWLNCHRLLEPIGYVPPVEYEEAFYLRQEAPTELATLK